MASTLKDSVLHWRKKLERTSDDYTVLGVIHKLSKVPITIELLQDTGIGKVIRNLAKQSGKVGVKASAVLHNWRKVLASDQKSPESSSKSSHPKHGSSNKESSGKDNVPSTVIHESKNDHKKKKSSESKHGQRFSHSHISKEKDSSLKTTKKHNVETVTNTSHQERKKVDTSKTIHSRNYALNGDEVFSDDVTETIEYDKMDSPNISLSHTNHISHKDECETNGKRKLSKKAISSDDTPEPKKRKTDSSQLLVSHEKSKVPIKDNLNSCKKKDKKSHSSGSHSRDKISQKALSDNHLIKKPDTQKPKTEKAKKSDSEKKRHSELKKTLQMQSTDAFTSSEVRFEDCLSFNDIVPVKRKKSSKVNSEKKGKHVSEKKKCETEPTKSKQIENLSSSSKTSKADKKVTALKKFPTETSHTPPPKVKEVDIASTLPQPQINYRPLPHRNYDCFPSKRKVLSNEDAIKFTSSKREKTAVYSGRKNLFFTEVPSLFESCTRILIEHIDAIEYLGGVPYYLLKPVLERCTSQQLDNIEHFNPNLLDDSHELWEVHCKKDFRMHQPQENETWRDLYWRAYEERERKLKTLTENISASMSSKSNTGRSVKLTYVDTFVKPPRDVARKQMKNGTGLPVNHTVKAGPPSKATPRPTAPAINSAATAASTPKIDINPKKPKVAPLMAKTLKSMKQCFRR